MTEPLFSDPDRCQSRCPWGGQCTKTRDHPGRCRTKISSWEREKELRANYDATN